MTPTPSLWYWLTSAIFIIASGLMTLLFRKLNREVKEVRDETSGCKERHKNIDQALLNGRTRFTSIEELVREEIRSINSSIQLLGQVVGELKGSIETALKLRE